MLQKDHLVDLNKFERLEKIESSAIFSFRNDHKYFKLLNTENRSFYTAKTWKSDLQELSMEAIIDFYREVYIHSRISHPSIIKFNGYSLINFKNKNKPVIVTEYVSNTTLQNILDSYSTSQELLNDTKQLIIIYGISSGMSYLHSHGILHRNLMPEKILLDNNYYPKISGLDFIKEISPNLKMSLFESRDDSNLKTESAYFAPETLTDLQYSKSSEVYSFGLIVYSILKQERQYFFDISDILKRRKEMDLKDEIPDFYADLLSRCLSEDPNNRPSFDEIVHDLKTNPKYLTDSVNQEDYFNYIKYIDESPISFDDNSSIPKLEEIAKKKNSFFS